MLLKVISTSLQVKETLNGLWIVSNTDEIEPQVYSIP
jgi:hypothetical protein